jgi:2-polyprenyl-6-methoxyphenol hydroxylase-like FAD-dependent oxidoreductase
MAPVTRVRTLVVGGGVGGLAAALALARVGREARVLEAAPQFSEIGAGIQLAPNATRALDALGVFDSMIEQAVFPRELVYMDALSGERVTSIDLGEPFVARYGHPYVVMHRTDLHKALLDACAAHPDVTLETNRCVEHIDDRGDTTFVRCTDGSAYEADALIGADGLHSVVRKTLSDDQPVPSEYVAYRGTIPFSQVTPHAGVDSMVMWVAPDLHLVQYKLRGGSLYNQVGVFRSARYGQAEDWGSADELDEHFSRCCEPVSYGASLLGRNVRWPMYDRDPIDNWTRNHVTLLGDAAHPMLQYIAQGGCQAIEDAVSLAHHVDSHDDLNDAFNAYQAERIPRTARVQRSARRFGDVCHIHGVGMELRNALFSQRDPRDYDAIDWLYGPPQREPVAAPSTKGIA